MTSSSSQSSVQMSSSSSHNNNNNNEAEVSSMAWELIKMSPQEEDLIHRMHHIVGDRWGLIAGRIPGRTAEEIERFWIMKHSHHHVFAHYTRRSTTTATSIYYPSH
ncbi:unnamed protein product [Cuscuta campestris]|uniref:Myb-like domain-containing protein n=1 Tax=Cuscuta campestris TaxID=132261 RepID=A0A484LH06_9ASTE|nr:unnamed protein product [Cuscuta campestris]